MRSPSAQASPFPSSTTTSGQSWTFIAGFSSATSQSCARYGVSTQQTSGQRIADAFDAWFAYVETHPYAWRMLFADTSADPEVQAVHRDVAAQSRAALLPLLAQQPGAAQIAGSQQPEALDLLWEIVRSVLQGLALWWYEHQHVPRQQIVTTAMNALWIGFERARQGDSWTASTITGTQQRQPN